MAELDGAAVGDRRGDRADPAGGRRGDRAAAASAADRARARLAGPAERRPAGRAADGLLAGGRVRGAGGFVRGSAATCSTSTSAAWTALWRDTPASFDGRHYSFRDIYFEPKAFRSEGPAAVARRGGHAPPDGRRASSEYGAGFNPLGRPAPRQMLLLRDAMLAAGRDAGEPGAGRRYARGVPRPGQRRRPGPGAGRDPAPRPRRASARSASSRRSSPTTPADVARFCRDIISRVSAFAVPAKPVAARPRWP